MNIFINTNNINFFLEKFLFGNSNIDVFLVTLIAGIFGFIIASIPFTIQLLEIKNNENINILNKNKIMKKKLFDKYFNVLKSSFWLFIFILFLSLIKVIYTKNMYINISLLFIYTILIYKFLRELYRLIRVLYNLVLIYLQKDN